MSEKLNEQSIQSWLANRSGWSVREGALVKEWSFKSFRDSIVFVNRVASLADESHHQPGIQILGGHVRLSLSTPLGTTPKGGAITKKDLDLAQAIDFATSAR